MFLGRNLGIKANKNLSKFMIDIRFEGKAEDLMDYLELETLQDNTADRYEYDENGLPNE